VTETVHSFDAVPKIGPFILIESPETDRRAVGDDPTGPA
jgi:hypothetical protein